MPFTPFHFGPGAAIKAAVPTRFSLSIFCYTQVITDLESLYYLMQREYPVHRFFHSYVGATLAAGACGITGKYVCGSVLAIIQSIAPRLFAVLVGVSAAIPWPTAFLSAFIGTYSHVFLDSIMHPD